MLKSSHSHLKAVEVIQRNLGKYPNDLTLRIYAGEYFLFMERRDLALEQFKLAVEIDAANLLAPHCDFKSLALLLRTATELGQYADAQAISARMIGSLSNPDAKNLAAMYLAHAGLALRHDVEEVARALRIIGLSGGYLSTDGVMGKVMNAVREARGFSIIRLGDGEARFMAYCDSQSTNGTSPQDRPAIVDAVWTSWFGSPGIESYDPAVIKDLSLRVDDAIETADVIGLPSESRLSRDKLHFGYLAYLADRMFRREHQENQHITDADINFDLLRAFPNYGPILRRQTFLGVVGCHEGLARKLGSLHAIPDTRSYSVPGEKGRAQLPAEVRRGEHFPARFHKLLDELDVPFPGAVFLVGAGLLGKVYCARIKALGGIAIDIGSVADAWAGCYTGPGSFGPDSGFTL